MLQQPGQAIIGYGYFTTGTPPTGLTGLTGTVDVYRIDVANNTASQVVTNAAYSEVGGGAYRYKHTSTAGAAYDYVFIFKTTNSNATAQHIPALWITGPTWVNNVDTTVSSRSSHSALDVWDADVGAAPFLDVGTIGEYVVTYLGVISTDAINTFTNTTTILNRIGAFAGSGVNTVLGFLQALARSDAAAPSNMGGTYDPATHSQQGLLTSLFKLDLSTVTGEAARSLLNAVRAIRNKTTVASNTLTVYKEDDATTAWTATVTADPTAAPITGVDP